MNLVVDFKSEYSDRDLDAFEENNLFMEPHFSSEGDKIIWFGAPNSVFVVELSTLSSNKIGNLLLDYDNEAPEPLCAIANFDTWTFLVHYEIDDQGALVFKQGDAEADPLLVDDVLPRFEGVKCMDLSADKQIGFAGGWTRSGDPLTGSTVNRAIIAGFEFRQGLPIVAQTELGASMVNNMLIGKKRENILFALTDTLIFILEFKRDQRGWNFEIKNQIDTQFEESKYHSF